MNASRYPSNVVVGHIHPRLRGRPLRAPLTPPARGASEPPSGIEGSLARSYLTPVKNMICASTPSPETARDRR